VDEETEDRLSKLIEAKAADFKSPDFRIEIPASPTSPVYPASSDSSPRASGSPELEEVKFDGEVGLAEIIKPATKIEISEKAEFAGEAGFVGKYNPAGVIAGKLEITELSGILRTSSGIENTEKKSTKKSIEASKSIEISTASLDSSGLAPGSNSEQPSDSESEIKPEIKPEIKLETKPESELPESEPEKEIQKLSEHEVKGKPGKEIPGKAGKQTEEKPARATELGKTGKAGQKKGKGKTAIPRQYNLGDYL
jgi:hypothetical protein